MSNLETQKSYKYLQEVEELAQDILTIKDRKLQVANVQNKLREALAALGSLEDRSSWVEVGSVYVQRPTEEIKELLKSELSKADNEVNDLHQDLKTKTHKLRDLEHEPRLEGFTLTPISVSEAKALHKENMPKSKKVAAGFVIFRRLSDKIEYLLLQTSYGIHHWTPPKGHVDPGESVMMTAFRETEEESGMLKSDLKVFDDSEKILHYQVNGKPKTVHYWLAELINTNAKVRLSHEHQDFKWLELSDACKYSNYQDMQDVLLDFDKFIKNLG